MPKQNTKFKKNVLMCLLLKKTIQSKKSLCLKVKTIPLHIKITLSILFNCDLPTTLYAAHDTTCDFFTCAKSHHQKGTILTT